MHDESHVSRNREQLYVQPRDLVHRPGPGGILYYLRHGGRTAWLLLGFFSVFFVVGLGLFLLALGLAGAFGEGFARAQSIDPGGNVRPTATRYVIMGFGAAFLFFPLGLMNVIMTAAGN